MEINQAAVDNVQYDPYLSAVVVEGWLLFDTANSKFGIVIDGEQKWANDFIRKERADVIDAWGKKNNDISKTPGFEYIIFVPQEDFLNAKRLDIIVNTNDGEKVLKSYNQESIHSEMLNRILGITIDEKKRIADMYIIRGWIMAYDRSYKLEIVDFKGQAVEVDLERETRQDVQAIFPDCVQRGEEIGFVLHIKKSALGKGVVIQASNKRLTKKEYIRKEDFTRKVYAWDAFLQVANPAKWSDNRGYIKAYGLKGFIGQLKNSGYTRQLEYDEWSQHHELSEREKQKQRNRKFKIQPKFSIVVPLYKTPVKFLEKMIASVMAQTYSNWELCLSDGSGVDSPIKEILQQYEKKDARIKVVSRDKPLQISENTNAAIEIATGDFIAFADHDDELTCDALYECALALNKDESIEVIYSDEDKMSMTGKEFFQPSFKSDFNIDMLCSVNYICHLFVVKKEVIDKVGVLRSEFDGAQDYDFVLRCVEATKNIYHIPKVLYHWRSHQDSTAENPESKMYAFDAGARAIAAHYERIGVNATVSKGEKLGLYRTRFIRDNDSLISIIIPNKDHIDDLKRCLNSIDEKSTYTNYEYIIVENNSTEEATFAFYKELEKSNPKAKVVYFEGPFNYAAINNFGATFAGGEYLLLLNNDIEIINDDCLEELLGYCMRDDVGIVGARMYYEDDTIQHAGVIIGFGGIAGHSFVHQDRSDTGYANRAICAQDLSAVTAACLLVKKTVFDEVDGLTEELAVAFNDIDFCLKVRELGKLVVYNPYAELYHYESKSRGLENTPEKIARFNREIAIFKKRWASQMKKGDPYYNPNLTLKKHDFSLKGI